MGNQLDKELMDKNSRSTTVRWQTYVAVFVVLVILTALEVGVTYLPVPRLPVLLPISIAKAALVALFYMHLKSDKRIFSALFAFGLLAGIGMIISFLLLFGPTLIDLQSYG
jgi:caa(3)-type oxidase subunit IV